MAHGNLLRRALTDLSANTVASPRPMSSSKETTTSLKRHVDEIDDPEYPSASIRCRVQSGKALQGQLPEKQTSALQEKTSACLTSLHALELHPQITDGADEMDDGSSQNSSKESVCSPPEFDVGDETMASQETAATEVTRIAEPMATLHAETLRLRLRVALFKVQTNQTNIPMSQLQISAHQASRSLEPVPMSSSPLRESSLPKLLPAPVLQPTAYSSRTISQQKIPTSPPDSTITSPESAPKSTLSSRLATSLHRHPSDPIQTSSPPSSPENMQVEIENWESSARSARRGKAARGLLDMRSEKQ